MALFSKPKYSTVTIKRKEIPENVWKKCPVSSEMVYNKQLETNAWVVPKSGYHFPMTAQDRLKLLLDAESFEEYDSNLTSCDPLQFNGVASYKDKLTKSQQSTGMKDAVLSGVGAIEGMPVSIAVMDFRFLGASMGSVVGEKITRAIERGLERRIPVIVVSASGGARMYEGILSLMQMAKTSAALAKLSKAKVPYISILTNPTMAGVMASFASLGDLILAEPGALIGFAGPRVIKDITKSDLPHGFQTSEFLLKHGLIDQIIDRRLLRERLAYFLKVFTKKDGSKDKPLAQV